MTDLRRTAGSPSSGVRRGALRAMTAASAALTLGVIPVFLVGALSGSIGSDLGFGAAGTGLAITIFFAAGGITAIPMGRLTERIGARAALRLGVAVSGLSTLALGTLADQWWQLAAILAVAGPAIGLIDTGGARLFADAIRVERQGFAFGAKEASVPAASMLAGFSIPLLAEQFGWPWVFVAGAGLAPFVWLLVPGASRLEAGDAVEPQTASPADPGGSASLVLFAVGIGAGAAASSAAATLFVPAVSDIGWSGRSAGLLLAVASIVSILARLILGWLSDQTPRSTWWLLAGVMGLGSAGALVLAQADGGALVPIGAVAVLGAGWGWTGLAFVSAVRSSPDAPAVAAAIVLTGLAAGGAIGPAAFGVIASTWSYGAAWVVGAGALGVGAVLTMLTRPVPPPTRTDIDVAVTGDA